MSVLSVVHPFLFISSAPTGVDLVEGLRVQTGSYKSDYGGQGATGQQPGHLRVLLQGRQHLGTHLLLQTQQLHRPAYRSILASLKYK